MRDDGTANLQSVTRAIRALELIAEAGSLGVTELGPRARRPQGDRLPADRDARRARPAGARSRHREVPARVRPDPAGRRGHGGTRPGPHGAPDPGGPRRADARDREPRRALGRRGRVRRSGLGDARDRQRELGRPQHAAALLVERQGAARQHARRRTRPPARAPARTSDGVHDRRRRRAGRAAPRHPRPRLRADARGAGGGVERGRRARPRRRRSGGRGAVGVGSGVPDAPGGPAADRAARRWRRPAPISRRLGYVERGRTAAG